jgi:hypothetical protein
MELTDDLTAAIEEVKAVEKTSHSGPIERLEAEQDAMEVLEEAVSEAVRSEEASFELENIQHIASEMRQFLPNHTKTDIKRRLRDQVEADTDLEKPEMTRWIEAHVGEIKHVRSTDKSKQDLVTEFHLDIDGASALTVELNPNTGGLKYHSPQWWQEAVETETGTSLAEPEQSSDEIDWHDWINAVIHGERGDIDVEEKSPVGNRTATVHALQGEIRESRAYTDLADAVVEGALYVNEDAGEVFVPQPRITDLIEDHTIGVTGFRRELDARGYCTNNDGRFSTTELAEVDGEPRWADYWMFDLELAEPAVIDPDGSDALEAVQSAVNGDTDDTDSDDSDSMDGANSGDVTDAEDDDASSDVDAMDAVQDVVDAAGENGLKPTALKERCADEYDLSEANVEISVEQLQKKGVVYRQGDRYVSISPEDSDGSDDGGSVGDNDGGDADYE